MSRSIIVRNHLIENISAIFAFSHLSITADKKLVKETEENIGEL